MANDEPKAESAHAHSNSDTGVSRRKILSSAGAVLASVRMATAEPAAAGPASDDDPHGIGVANQGATVAEFRSRIVQSGSSGETFIAYGYLTKLTGANDDDLFASQPPSESTALLTVYAEGALVKRVLDQNVHALDVEGEFAIFQRSGPGASFANVDSFHDGTEMARFAMTLQDMLAVFAPGRGIPTLTGDMRQITSERLVGTHRRVGRVGARTRLFATGLGTLVDPVTLNAQLEMAGNWTMS